MEQVSLQLTEDGSHTLFNATLNETYHSHRGALAESQYVFIDSGLDAVVAQSSTELDIFEVGFGTGLNALMTLGRHQQINQWRQSQQLPLLHIRYLTVEPYPLDSALIGQLNYTQLLPPRFTPLFDALHGAKWDEFSEIQPGFSLCKCHSTLEAIELTGQHCNLIYFDAFAPNKQPSVWQRDNFAKCYQALCPQGLLVSYCANGQFKRDLRSVGFTVKAHPGALGKREMTRAWRLPAEETCR